MGYDAISTYQVSATTYIAGKVMKRLYIISSFSAAILIILSCMMYFLLRQIIRMQQGQLQTLRFYGEVRQRPLELNVYITVDPCGCVGIGCDVCGISIPELRSATVYRIWQYQSVWSLLWFFVYNLAVAVVATPDTDAFSVIGGMAEWRKEKW